MIDSNNPLYPKSVGDVVKYATAGTMLLNSVNGVFSNLNKMESNRIKREQMKIKQMQSNQALDREYSRNLFQNNLL